MAKAYFRLNWAPSRLTSTKPGVNVTTKYWASQGNVNYRRSTVPGRAWSVANSSEVATEAIPAKPNCGHWELPATPVWDCDFHYGSLQRDRRGVRNLSIAGLAGKRRRTGL